MDIPTSTDNVPFRPILIHIHGEAPGIIGQGEIENPPPVTFEPGVSETPPPVVMEQGVPVETPPVEETVRNFAKGVY